MPSSSKAFPLAMVLIAPRPLMIAVVKASSMFRVNFIKIEAKTTFIATPLWGKCEDETRTPKSGNLESSGTPKTSKFDCRGQKTLHCSVLYIIGKILKCRCRKWVRMSHLDIFSTSYGKKKGRESNWQFDSQPLKVGNRPDLGSCRWSAAHY